MTRRAPLGLLALCCAVPLWAANQDPWLRITSANFEFSPPPGNAAGAT